jgi:hypothetical protein
MATKKHIPDVEEQWLIWSDEFTSDRFEHIDTDKLKENTGATIENTAHL